MKTIKSIIDDFSGVTPLFPLPDFVFFPQTVQPFHIFEPRYLDLFHDIEEGEGLVTIPMIIGDPRDAEPKFYDIATLGFIHQVSALEDGTLNVLVTGLVKAHIEEVESTHRYRRGAITPIEEFADVHDSKGKIKLLLRKFEAILEKSATAHNLEILVDQNLPIEMVTHMIIASMHIDAVEKQKMLELQSLDLRIEILINFLESGLGSLSNMGQFDPIVPSNPLWN